LEADQGDEITPHDSLRVTHTSAEALGPIRNQASEPVTTAPLSAAMTRNSQDMLPILVLGVCEKAAAPEFDLSAGAIVSVPAAVTTVAAAGDASLAGRAIHQCQHSQRQQGAVGEVQAEPSLDPLIARGLEALQARFDGPVGNIEGSTWRYSGESAEKDHSGASPRFGRVRRQLILDQPLTTTQLTRRIYRTTKPWQVGTPRPSR
jgi:hypothetical protein